MATLPPHSNSNGKNRTTKWRVVAVAMLILTVGFVVLWLVGVGVFRQPAAQPAPRTTPLNPPAALNTAADYVAQGDYNYDLGHYDDAIANYTRAIRLQSDFAEAYNNRAYTYMTKHEYALALPDLDLAIQLRPNYVNALMNRGDIYNYYYAIDYDRAIADYDRVLQLSPEHTSVCGHRMLAVHHGWNLSVFGEILTRGTEAGCPRENPAH
ncbi:MAG: tetratricopeptide repeat protein [Chloroflexota bacterium]